MLDLPRESWTLVHAVRAQAQELGERPFLTFHDGVTLTFGELDRRSDCVASALARLGVRPVEARRRAAPRARARPRRHGGEGGDQRGDGRLPPRVSSKGTLARIMREEVPTLTPALSLSEGEGAMSIPSRG